MQAFVPGSKNGIRMVSFYVFLKSSERMVQVSIRQKLKELHGALDCSYFWGRSTVEDLIFAEMSMAILVCAMSYELLLRI